MNAGENDDVAPGPARQDQQLLDAYWLVGVPADALPYSKHFDALLRKLDLTPKDVDDDQRRELFARLLRLRKSGQAPPIPSFGPFQGLPELSDSDVQALASLVTKHAGSLGQRDRLAYTAQFDELRREFEVATSHRVTNEELWRLVLRRAKQPHATEGEPEEPRPPDEQ
jgi:hypothetical protein